MEEIERENEICRYGTYLGSQTEVPDRFWTELCSELRGAMEKASDPETREILSILLQSAENRTTSLRVKDDRHLGFEISPQELHWLLKHPRTKWAPYLTYRYRFKIHPRMKKLGKFPPYLLIEPTSICNLRCIMCFQVDKSFTKREYMGRMPWDLFKKVADQAFEHECGAVTLASRGEPTIHPDLPKMLKYLSDGGILDLKLNTNATRLNEKMSHAILEAEVSEMVYSVDAGTKDTYESIRVKGKFEEVVRNIDQFNEIRAKHYPRSPTTTRVTGVKVKDEQDIEQMESFWSERVDEVTVKSAVPRWDTYNNEKVDKTEACDLFWERMYVWYDGTVNPCDIDYKSRLAAGNANEQSLSEIWTGEKYQRMRKVHVEGKRQCLNPCDRCPF